MIGSTGAHLHSKLPVVQKNNKKITLRTPEFLRPKDGATRQVKVFTEG